MKMMRGVVYVMSVLDSGKVIGHYIGATTNLTRRKSNHASALSMNCHGNSAVQDAWNECENPSLEFSVKRDGLVSDYSHLIDMEREVWSEVSLSGEVVFNKHEPSVKNSTTLTAKFCEKTSSSNTGKKRGPDSLANIRAAANARKAKSEVEREAKLDLCNDWMRQVGIFNRDKFRKEFAYAGANSFYALAVARMKRSGEIERAPKGGYRVIPAKSSRS